MTRSYLPFGSDLKNAKLIWLKGILFLTLGILASLVMIARNPDWTQFALHAIAIWAFCRCYYFAFYVIEHYVDSTYRFAGLIDFIRYAARREPAERRD